MMPLSESAATPLAGESAVAAGLLDDGETILLAVRPSGWFVPLVSWPVVVLAGVAAVAGWGVEQVWATGLPRAAFAWSCAAAALARLAVACVQWMDRLYLLTDRRLMWIRGVARFRVRQVPLRTVRGTRLTASRGEHLLGLASLHVLTERPGAGEEPWVHLARPAKVQQAVEEAVRRRGGGRAE